MWPILSAIKSLLGFRFRSRASLELEVIALRHQLKLIERQRRRKRERRNRIATLSDRIFWVILYRLWPACLKYLVVLKPDTVIKWHYKGFRLFWSLRSRRRGYPVRASTLEAREIIRRMQAENPLWGAGRISGEIHNLGIEMDRKYVWKQMRKFNHTPGPGWTTFLKNHMSETAAADFFVAITATYRFLYGFLIIDHHRRRIIHFEVTAKPNQNWVIGQVVKTFRNVRRPRFLITDNDPMFGRKLRHRLKQMGIEQHCITPYSPWENFYVERVIGTFRRECLDHIIPLSESHLRRVVSSYVRYYNGTRPHKALRHDSPDFRLVQDKSKGQKIIAIPEVGGLHHRYERRAA